MPEPAGPVRTERHGDVLVATIDRAGDDLNRVDHDVHAALTRLMAELRRETEARAVLLTGAGRAFSAGGDFAWFPELDSLDALHALRRDARQMIWDLLDVELPVVCALNGAAIGLGASLALLCDVVVAADTSVIADPHVRVGIVAGDGGTAIWPLLLGPMRAKAHLLTGDPISAVDAHAAGLVTEVTSADEVHDRGLAWAERLAASAPLAVRYTKQAVNAQVKRALLDSFEPAVGHELVTFLSDDHREALAARDESRPPMYRGR